MPKRQIIQHWKPQRLWGRTPNSPHIKDWILQTQSLTAKIRRKCPQMRVKVLSEAQQRPLPAEAKQLKLHHGETAWVRCVLLYCDQHPIIYARTVIPNLTPGNPWYALKTLGNQPLGEVLFKLKNTQRTQFCWQKNHQAWPFIENSQKTPAHWARSSRFYQKNHPLLLTEVFLNLPPKK